MRLRYDTGKASFGDEPEDVHGNGDGQHDTDHDIERMVDGEIEPDAAYVTTTAAATILAMVRGRPAGTRL